MIIKKVSFSHILVLLVIHVILILLSFQTVIANDNKDKISKNPNDWYFIKIPPKKLEIFGDKFVQTEYIFQNTDKSGPCIRNCPYKYPVWDDTIESVNNVLSFIGLPTVKKLVQVEHKYGRKTRREFTSPNYPLGEIILFKGKYFPHLWKIIIRKR